MKIKNILYCFIAVFLFFSCSKNRVNTDEEIVNIKGTPVVVREIPDEATGFGSLSFLSKVDIASPQEAVIKNIYYREGDFVKQGETIVQLENPQIKLAVERAENNYSQALAACNLASSRLLEGSFQAEAQLLAFEKSEAEISLMKKMWEENQRKHNNQEKMFKIGGVNKEAYLISQFTLETEWEQIELVERELEIRMIGCRDQDLIKAGIAIPVDECERKTALVDLMTSGLKAELEAAGARLEAAKKELSSANIAFSQLTVKSPASGIIGARYLEEGERVQAQDKILSLIDTTSLYAIFPVREKDALKIEKGMSASVLSDGTGEIHEGFVDLVYPQADSQSLSFLVRVLIKNNNLKPGMFVRTAVTLGPPKKVIFIPETAVFNQVNNGKNEGSVFIVNGTRLSERKIILGSSYGDEREILSGLTAGEIIAARPESNLREGLNVSVVY